MAFIRILFFVFFSIPLTLVAKDSEDGIAADDPIVVDIETLTNMANNYGSAKSSVVAAANTIRPKGSYCETLKKAADVACLESLSPNIVKFISQHGDMTQMMMMMGSSLGEQCKGISDMLTKANMALGAFQAACGSAQHLCTSSCGDLKGSLAKYKSAEASAIKQLEAKKNSTEQAMQNACSVTPPVGCPAATKAAEDANREYIFATTSKQQSDPIIAKLETRVGQKENICASKYKINSGQAMMGAMAALQGYAKSKQCEKLNSNANIAAIDCQNSQSPGYNTPNCMCARGEKSAAECQNININAASIKPGAIAIPKIGSTSATDPAISAAGEMVDESSGFSGENANLAGSPPPVEGGGGGGVGGGSAGSGYGQDGGGNSGRRINTNVLGGGFGGGGGGGGGAGPGYGELDPTLKGYMPGGKNDPNRTIASQLAKEVTPEGGRSNWEKVRLRYRDNQRSLLNVGK